MDHGYDFLTEGTEVMNLEDVYEYLKMHLFIDTYDSHDIGYNGPYEYKRLDLKLRHPFKDEVVELGSFEVTIYNK